MKKIAVLIFGALLCIQCAKKEDPFLFGSQAVGKILKTTTAKEVDLLYESDSVVKQDIEGIVTNKNIEIFEKGGAKLLSLEPSEEGKDDSTFDHIQIFDSRFKTDKGVGLSSTFADFTTHYEVKRIERIMNLVNVFFKNEDFYITIDMKELPMEIRVQPDFKIDPVHIPNRAKLKYLMISWN